MSGRADSKICITCKVEKPRSDFSPNVAKKDGKQGQCRTCCNRRRTAARRKVPVYLSNRVSEPGVQYITGECSICDTVFDKASSQQKRCSSCSRLVLHDLWPRLGCSRNGRGKLRGPNRPSISDVNEIARRWVRSHTCRYCGEGFTDSNGKTLDHIIPYCKGGSNTANNIAICHKDCNAAKAGLTLTEWIDLCARVSAHASV